MTRIESRSPRESGSSFAETLLPLVSRAGGEGADHESLAHIDYAGELAAKQEGLNRFWRAHRLAGAPEAIVPSPRPRHYRTSSKRRVAVIDGRPVLFLGEVRQRGKRGKLPGFTPSALEPEEHAAVYRRMVEVLSEPAMRLLASHLNYLIIRGSYEERVLILNVDQVDGAILRRIKQLTAGAEALSLRGVFVYLDPTRSAYHFESRRPAAPVTFKRVWGIEQLSANYSGCRYRYHPTSFSQVNASIVPELLGRARELLAPSRQQSLLDLYCGYGLFSHYLAPSYARVLGVDAEGPSVRAAAANVRLNPRGAPRRFIAARIDRDFVSDSLPRASGDEVILLDPPRNGPQHGVLTALARRQPRRVLHVFCEVDQIPPSLERWRAADYVPQRVVPLDMFPGSANLEVLVLLAPAKEHAPGLPRRDHKHGNRR